tara:strand:- start:66 stop:665 length:600 start_codon:yes stop_codon:yes gene_type:complete
MALTATTKLEAVNTLLTAIGEAPVNSLTSGLVDAETAETILDSVSREVQSQGWAFNTNYLQEFTPNSDLQIVIAPDVLRIDMADNRSTTIDVVARGSKLYNRATNSFYFEATAAIKMNTVVVLEFTDLPEAARRYITIRSARVFQDRVVGSDLLHGFHQQDELRALVELKDSDSQVNDHNIFDNYSVASVIDRIGGRVL